MTQIPPSEDSEDYTVHPLTGNMRLSGTANVNAMLRDLIKRRRARSTIRSADDEQ